MTLLVATGPHNQVTGANSVPKARELGAMLMPVGWNSAEE